MCSKKDYVRAAKLVQTIRAEQITRIATMAEECSLPGHTGASIVREAFVEFFRADVPNNFDAIRFREACGE